MKKIEITQTYEMTVIVTADVPDDWSDGDTVDYFADFPLHATVKSEYSRPTKGVKNVEMKLDSIVATHATV
jgi:hypothetical protein